MLNKIILPQIKNQLEESKITIIGLDGSGKTTFLNQLLEKKDQFFPLNPTREPTISTIYHGKAKLTFYDVPGQKVKRQEIWKPLLKSIHGLVF